MSKAPTARFPSLGQFADALDAAREESPTVRAPSSQPTEVSPALDRVLADFLEKTSVGGPLLSDGLATPPTCSVNFGAAGIAFALYRLWRVLGDPDLMVAAKAWLDRAERDRSSSGAFYDGAGFTPAVFGRVSPYHTESGPALVGGLISRACRDSAAERDAIDAFLARTDAPCRSPDLTLGRSSVLLGAALLLEGADPEWAETERLRRRGDDLLARIWEDVATMDLAYLGVAHGWAGIVYATLLWSRARGVAPPPVARAALDDLGWLSEPCGRGLRWPMVTDEPIDGGGYAAGWCNGDAGHVFVWTLASSTYREPEMIEYAERAAWSTWDEPSGVTSLCCGAAGESYALLNLHRCTGERAWLSRATARANLAAATFLLAGDAKSPLSLYKGHTGLALLAAELRRPELSAMPLFEPARLEPFDGLVAGQPVPPASPPASLRRTMLPDSPPHPGGIGARSLVAWHAHRCLRSQLATHSQVVSASPSTGAAHDGATWRSARDAASASNAPP
jgi:hypothetical protein